MSLSHVLVHMSSSSRNSSNNSFWIWKITRQWGGGGQGKREGDNWLSMSLSHVLVHMSTSSRDSSNDNLWILKVASHSLLLSYAFTFINSSCLLLILTLENFMCEKNRIYHYIEGGMIESHPSVYHLQSITRLAKSWMLQILDIGMGFLCPSLNVMTDYFSHSCLKMSKIWMKYMTDSKCLVLTFSDVKGN